MADSGFGIAAQVKAPAFDAVETMGKLQGLQQGQLQNRLLGLNLAGKQSLGRIIGQNTGENGEVDYAGASRDAAADPAAAIMLPEFQAQGLQRQISQIQLQRDQIGLSGEQWKVTGASALSLLGRKGPDGKPAELSGPEVIQTLTRDAQSRGLLNDPNFATRLAALSADLKDKDPAAVREALSGVALLASPTAETLGLLRGAPSTVTNGSQTIQQQVSPLTGEISVNGVVNQGRSATEKAALVQVWNPTTKQYEMKPSGSIIGDMAPGSVPGQADSGARAPATVLAGPALGEAAAAEDNVAQAQALQKRAAIAPERVAALKNIGDTLADFTPGPNSQLTLKANGHLVQLADQFGIPVSASIRQGVASREEANKLFAQVALQQWGALGGSGSNDQLAAAMKSNPSETISTLGMKNLVALLQGNEDAIGAQFQAWKKYSATHGANSYGDFLAGWNAHYDPRAFQYEHMSPAARKAMVGKMSPKEKTAFGQALSFAEQVTKLGQ